MADDGPTPTGWLTILYRLLVIATAILSVFAVRAWHLAKVAEAERDGAVEISKYRAPVFDSVIDEYDLQSKAQVEDQAFERREQAFDACIARWLARNRADIGEYQAARRCSGHRAHELPVDPMRAP